MCHKCVIMTVAVGMRPVCVFHSLKLVTLEKLVQCTFLRYQKTSTQFESILDA